MDNRSASLVVLLDLTASQAIRYGSLGYLAGVGLETLSGSSSGSYW